MGFIESTYIYFFCNILYYSKYGKEATRSSLEIHWISLVRMQGQETRDLGAMIVQQGDKWSFEMLHGHSRLERPNEKSCWVYVLLPAHPS